MALGFLAKAGQIGLGGLRSLAGSIGRSNPYQKIKKGYETSGSLGLWGRMTPKLTNPWPMQNPSFKGDRLAQLGFSLGRGKRHIKKGIESLRGGGLGGSIQNVTKTIGDDIGTILKNASQLPSGTNLSRYAGEAQTWFLQNYGRVPGAEIIAARLGQAIKSGKTNIASLDIKGALTTAGKLAAGKGGPVRNAQAELIRAKRALDPTRLNVADDAWQAVISGGKNIGSNIAGKAQDIFKGIGGFAATKLPGVADKAQKIKTGMTKNNPFGKYATKRGSGADYSRAGELYGGGYATKGPGGYATKGPGGYMAKIPDWMKTKGPSPEDIISQSKWAAGVPTYSLGGIGKGIATLPWRATKGYGKFMWNRPLVGTAATAGALAYGPDALDWAGDKAFGESPEEQLREGVGSLMGSERNRRRTLGDLGSLYAQGEIGRAIGTPGARNLAEQQMRQYVGGTLFGEQGYGNIPMREGYSMFAGEGAPSMAGDIFNNPARESIMKSFGMQMDDEEIIEKYSKILDKQRRKKALNADDIKFLMMFEALNKPTNLPTDQFKRNESFERARAYQDVENQLGGQFEVIDYNDLYPTYAQPQTTLNAAYGGAVNGSGTGTSDSIPARLSDGEFVMTADAVRGAGNGNRKDGVRKMYDLMNNLEGR